MNFKPIIFPKLQSMNFMNLDLPSLLNIRNIPVYYGIITANVVMTASPVSANNINFFEENIVVLFYYQ